MKRPLLSLLILLFLFTCLHAQSPGSLDLTFGGTGYVTHDFQNEFNTSKLVFLQPDGKILVLGNTNTSTNVLALRFHSDGTLDNGFGTAGVFKEAGFGYPVSSVDYSELWSGELQSDGKIVLAGMIKVSNIGSFIFLIRLNSNGTKDSTFGINGIFRTPIINNFEPLGRSVKIASLSDGKIILFTGVKTDKKFSLIRVNANGTLDNTFGTGGVIDVSSSSGDIFSISALALAIQSDGKILAQGVASTAPNNTQGYVFRFLPDGTLDNTFSSDGEFQINDYAGPLSTNNDRRSIIPLPDGKVLISRSSTSGIGISRIKSDGTIDNTFGTNGTAYPGFTLYAMVSQFDGKIVCPGVKSGQGILLRLNSNGSIDYSFGNTGGGYATIPATSRYSHLLQQPDGKIVACGNKDNDFVVGRHFSQVVSAVKEENLFEQVTIGPNPSNGHFSLRFHLSKAQNLSISLFNLSGQLIQTIEPETRFVAGEHQLPVQLPNLPAGNYIVRMVGEKGQKAVKVQLLGNE